VRLPRSVRHVAARLAGRWRRLPPRIKLGIVILIVLAAAAAAWLDRPEPPSADEAWRARVVARQNRRLGEAGADRAYERRNAVRLNRFALDVQALEIRLENEGCLPPATLAAHRTEGDALRIDHALRTGRQLAGRESEAALFALAPFAGWPVARWTEAEDAIRLAPGACPDPEPVADPLQPMVTNAPDNGAMKPPGM